MAESATMQGINETTAGELASMPIGRVGSVVLPIKAPLARLSAKLSPVANLGDQLSSQGYEGTAEWYEKWKETCGGRSLVPMTTRWTDLDSIIAKEKVPFPLLCELANAIRNIDGPVFANVAVRRALAAATIDLDRVSPGTPKALDICRKLEDARYSLWQTDDWADMLTETELEAKYGESYGRHHYLARHFQIDCLRHLGKMNDAVRLSTEVYAEYSNARDLFSPSELADVAWLHCVILIQATQYAQAADVAPRAIANVTDDVASERIANVLIACVRAGRGDKARQLILDRGLTFSKAHDSLWIQNQINLSNVREIR